MSELKLSDIWDDATNAVCQAMQKSKMCKCKDGECIAAKIEPSAETVLHWNTRAVPDVPELVRYEFTKETVAYDEYYSMEINSDGEYVLHSQAAEIIAAKGERYENLWLNYCALEKAMASEMRKREAAEAELSELMGSNAKPLTKADRTYIIAHLSYELQPVGKQLAMEIVRLDNSVKEKEAKLAQYEAQKPVGCASVYIYKGRRNLDLNELGNDAAGELPIGDHKLYASPAPAPDLKAENERLREALQDIANLYQPRTPIQRSINIARAALNLDASND